ncbi:MAG: TonB-dependent receptor, partial [Bacteroidota bacterium]|nr:TonB-dependent receptor [Bacteroidota bacterium]
MTFKKILMKLNLSKNLLLIRLIFIFAIIFFNEYYTATAESEYIVSGYIKDSKTGESLIGVNIFDETTKKGCRTNSYGFFSLTLIEGAHNLRFSYIGYSVFEQKIELTENRIIDVELEPKTISTKEIVITAQKNDDNVKSSQMGVTQITPSEIRTIPVIFGEQDILKTLQLLPGISGTGEGSSGFNVRGGGPDQNMILLDEACVYSASHLMGFFSVFNSDAIKDVKVFKGTAPAEYGGRLSSLLDIKMNEGNSKEYGVKGGIGLISSRLAVEGPIIKDKSSFIVSGRRTYADIFLVFSDNENLKKSALYFFDLNMKANYNFSDDDKIFISGYLGRDVANFNDQFGFDWGNTTMTLRWNHVFAKKIFLNTSLIYSKYDYVVNIENGTALIDIRSSILDYNFKQ